MISFDRMFDYIQKTSPVTRPAMVMMVQSLQDRVGKSIVDTADLTADYRLAFYLFKFLTTRNLLNPLSVVRCVSKAFPYLKSTVPAITCSPSKERIEFHIGIADCRYLAVPGWEGVFDLEQFSESMFVPTPPDTLEMVSYNLRELFRREEANLAKYLAQPDSQ